MIALVASIAELAVPPSSPQPGSAISQAHLDAITDSCRAPRNWLELRGNQVVIKATPDDSAELRCVLKGVSAMLEAADLARLGDAEAPKEK